MIETPIGKSALEESKIRISIAIAKQLSKEPISRDVKPKTAQPLQSIISYGISRMIISCINQTVINKFVESEAIRSIEYFYKEPYTIQKEIESELGFNHTDSKIKISDYIPLHMTKYDDKYKLVNMKVTNGYVILTENADVQLVFKERLKLKLLDKLPLKVNNDAKEALMPVISDFTSKYNDIYTKQYGEVTIDDFPPCINSIISMINRKENPTHSGRFALVTFCNKIGMRSEDIVKLFQTVKDFEVNMTLYQVDHIIGKKGGVKYSAPSCNTMKTNNLCRCGSDPLCKKVKHPLGYYESMKRLKKRQQKSL